MSKKISIDFCISSDIYNLWIIDNSCWGVAKDLPAVIEITTPGMDKSVKYEFSKNEHTTFDSNSLGLSCDECERLELPDGIYHVKLKASPDSFFKEYDYLKVDLLEKSIAKVYIGLLESGALKKGCDNGCVKDLFEAKNYLSAAQSYVFYGQIKSAKDMYMLSKDIIDRLVDCKGC